MRSLHQQRGMTAIGWMLVLAMIGFFTLLGLRMVPAYMEFYKVVSSLESLEKESGFGSPGEIRKLLERRFEISYVNVLTPADVTIKTSGNQFVVTAAYEKTEHIAGNAHVLMDFEKQVKVKRY